MTVFDNVAIALRMVGVKDKKEIEEKVNYVLELSLIHIFHSFVKFR